MFAIKPYKKKKRKRNNLEMQTQAAFFSWLSYYPRLRVSTFSIPNGGGRSLIEAVNLKRTGVLSGIPDVFMAIPNKTSCGAFIEFKASGNKVTKQQATMMEILQKNGYSCFVCCSLNEAREAVTKYLGDGFRPSL